jgi:Alpha/beta hydrolase domain
MRSQSIVTWSLSIAAGLLSFAVVPRSADARITRFVVEQRVPFASGVEWGTAGPYERLKGTAYMEVDPSDPLNAIIFNLDKAPRNALGMVEFSSPFLILKPMDMSRGNRKFWYGINNRGNCIELGFRAFPAVNSGCSPLTVADVGQNNVLLQSGYATVDAGWHGDGLTNPNQLYPSFPVATHSDGSAIVGPLRLEYQTSVATFTQPLVTGWRPYEAADTNTSHSTLTVRDRSDAPKVTIPSNRWAFGQCPAGPASLVPTTTDLCLFDGFTPFKIYELIYPAKNPIVMGLAHAVTRDIGSFLRYRTHDDAGNPNPLALNATTVGIRRAYSSGTSSTGMYQREFLYLGFNEDESHRQVFDAVTIYSAATHRLFANVQFAHPTFFSGQDQHHDYTSNSIAPFTFAVTTDPVSGVRDGILKRPATDPLVFQIDEELVFWQWKASLNVVDGFGNPVALPDRVRLYFQNGFGHIGAAGLLAPPQPPGICQHATKGLGGISMTPRALAVALDEWADKGIEPPKSRYPRFQNKTLVSLEEYEATFPVIPGVVAPSVMNEINVLNFGPGFNSTGGVQTLLPPALGPSYAVFVPKPDQDGVGSDGIDTMLTRAPLGTNTGWNLRTGIRAGDLCSLSGSYFPFARTKADRLANGDSRKSLEERYKDHAGFVKAVAKAGRELVKERFLLEQDAAQFVQAAQESDVLR